MAESINKLPEALSVDLELFVKAVKDFVKTIGRAFCDVYGSKLPCKPVHNYPELNISNQTSSLTEHLKGFTERNGGNRMKIPNKVKIAKLLSR